MIEGLDDDVVDDEINQDERFIATRDRLLVGVSIALATQPSTTDAST